MKKSTIISTLAMVVIVALALTTATFAWYQANTSVTATTKLTAQTSTGSNISINAGTDAGVGSTAALGDLAGMMPLVVTTKPITEAAAEADSTTATALSAYTLWGGYTTADAAATRKWTSLYDGDSTAGSANYKQDYFTLKNMSTSAADSVDIALSVNWSALTVDLTATALDTDNMTDEEKAAKEAIILSALRIAIFDGGDTTATLIAVLGNATTQFAHYGDYTIGTTTLADAPTVQTVAGNESVACATGITNLCTLKGGSEVTETTKTFGYVMYFDGQILTQDLSGAAIENIVLTFTAR